MQAVKTMSGIGDDKKDYYVFGAVFGNCEVVIPDMADIRKRIVFHGRVQGVGFRYTAKYLAQSLGLTGWVRNEWDGTVTLEIQGREMLINKLLVGLNHNQFITIDWMDTKEIPVEQENSFWVK